MYEGFAIIGDGQLNGQNFEIINNARAFAYACNAGMTWLNDCNICESAATVLTTGPDYVNPAEDLAPWYDPDDPDSPDFFGVMGMAITGAEDSTRTATVTAAATGGGVISALNYAPRTMVVRALAMAASECGLEYGLNWLRCQYSGTTDDCLGDVMTFFDCCPCACVNSDTPDPDACWVDTYRELHTDPDLCNPDWWPTTYAQLRDGPGPDESEMWCSWLKNYLQLATTGPPMWACCTEQCVVPYLRQFHNVRIIAGPRVLSRRMMHSRGSIAEVEFIIVASDPAEYGMPDAVATLFSSDTEPGTPYSDPPNSPPVPDPFSIPGWTAPRSAYIAPPVVEVGLPDDWHRRSHPVSARPMVGAMGSMVMQYEVYALDDTAGVRLGLWDGSELVDGVYLPPMAAGTSVVIDGASRRISGVVGGHSRMLSGFVRSFSGDPIAKWAQVPPGDMTLTIDRDAADAGRVRVEVRAAAKGCA